MSKQLILIDTDLSADSFKSVCPMGIGPAEDLQSIENYVVALEGGVQSADVSAKVGAVGASCVLTTGAASTAGQIFTLMNVSFTAKASGAVPASGEFNVGASSAQLDSILLAIDAVLGAQLDIVRDSASIAHVTLKVPGALGNGLQASAGNVANLTVGGFAGGSDGTAYTISSK